MGWKISFEEAERKLNDYATTARDKNQVAGISGELEGIPSRVSSLTPRKI